MSIATTSAPDQRFVWYQLSWDQYEGLLRALGDRRLRHTYVEGALEIVSPSMDHEQAKSLLGGLVEMLCRLLRVPRMSIGSTTMKKMRWKRGLEPDEGFFIGEESVRQMQSRRDYDLDHDPPPDLIIEVDITSSSDDRVEFYRRLKVPEVWRLRDNVQMLGLVPNGRYRRIKRSRLFPILSGDDLNRFLALRETMDDTLLDLEFEKWVRRQIERKQNSTRGK